MCNYLVIVPEKESRKNGEEIFEERRTEFSRIDENQKLNKPKGNPYINIT